MFWYLYLMALYVQATPLAWSQLVSVASGNPRRTGDPAEAKYSVSGTVVNSITGEPISHALVQIFADRRRMVFSDSQGHFTFTHLPPIQTMMLAFKPGFTPGHPKPMSQYRQMVTIGPNSTAVTLKLVPDAGISGSITDSNGEPLERVPVKLFSYIIENGVRKRQESHQAQTGDDGEFDFPDLPPGDYLLSAGPSWSGLFDPFGADSSDQTANSQKFYPGVQDVAEVEVIHLAAAKHQLADLTLDTVQTYTISGSVVGGLPGRGGLDVVNSGGQSVALAQRRDGADTFRIRVPAGHCIVKAHSGDDQGNQLYGQAELEVSGDVQGLRINVQKISIPVTVQRLDVRENSPENSQYRNMGGGSIGKSSENPVYLRLISLDPLHGDASSNVKGGPEHWVTEIVGLEYGRYRVEMTDEPPWYAQSMTYGATDLKSEPLVVSAGSTQPIELTLRNDAATLSVKVDSADDLPDFHGVVIAIADGNPFNPVLSHLNSRNQAQQISLPPGRYLVYSFEDHGDLEYANPEVMRKYSAKASSINLLPNQKAKVSVNLIRSAE